MLKIISNFYWGYVHPLVSHSPFAGSGWDDGSVGQRSSNGTSDKEKCIFNEIKTAKQLHTGRIKSQLKNICSIDL